MIGELLVLLGQVQEVLPQLRISHRLGVTADDRRPRPILLGSQAILGDGIIGHARQHRGMRLVAEPNRR